MLARKKESTDQKSTTLSVIEQLKAQPRTHGKGVFTTIPPSMQYAPRVPASLSPHRYEKILRNVDSFIKLQMSLTSRYTQQDIEALQAYLLIDDLVYKGKSNAMELRHYLMDIHYTHTLNQKSALLMREYDNTLLHLLIANERYLAMTVLLEALSDFVNPNIRDAEGKTILILASKMSHEALVTHILSRSFMEPLDIHAKDQEGRTALHYAFALGNLAMINMLLDHGADPTSPDRENKTPLDLASLSDEEISEIFWSVALEPERDEKAPNNSIHHFQRGSCPLTKENVDSQLALLNRLLDPNEPIDALRETLCLDMTHDGRNYKKMREVLEEERRHLTGQSLLERALAGQTTVKDLIQSLSLPTFSSDTYRTGHKC